VVVEAGAGATAPASGDAAPRKKPKTPSDQGKLF